MEVPEMELEVLEMGDTPTQTGSTGLFGSVAASALKIVFADDRTDPATVGSAIGAGIGTMAAGPIGGFVGSKLGEAVGGLLGPGKHHPAEQYATSLPGANEILERQNITYGSRIIPENRYWTQAFKEMTDPAGRATKVLLDRLGSLGKLPYAESYFKELSDTVQASEDYMFGAVSGKEDAQNRIQQHINTLYDAETRISNILGNPEFQEAVSHDLGIPFEDWLAGWNYATDVAIETNALEFEYNLQRDSINEKLYGQVYGTNRAGGKLQPSNYMKEMAEFDNQYTPISYQSGPRKGKPRPEPVDYTYQPVTGLNQAGPGRGKKKLPSQTIAAAEYKERRLAEEERLREEYGLNAIEKKIEDTINFINPENHPEQFGTETPYFGNMFDPDFTWEGYASPIPATEPETPTTGLIPVTDEGQYTPPDPTVQDPEPTEPGFVTEPEPTPVETPTETPTETPGDQGLFSDKAIAQFFSDEEQEAIVSNLEKAKAADADADATPSDRNDAWGKVALGLAAGAGLYGLSRLFRSDNGETTDGDINNLPRLNLNIPSSNRFGLNFSNTGGLTPVPPPALATLPTGVQYVRGIVPEFKYEDDDYVKYPTGKRIPEAALL